jgi:glycosyltransferase involved in cell wall biosynthesis
MKNVAYLVSDYFAPSHTFVRREVAALRDVGLIVTPFSIQASGQASEAQSVFNRPMYEYPLALLHAVLRHPRLFFSSWWLGLKHRPPGVRALVWSQFHFIEAMLLARLVRAAGCTSLHNHFANSAATVGMVAANYLCIPWSFTLHGISETDYPAGLLLQEKLERADFVACASYFMQAQAMRAVDYRFWTKMHIVRCGVTIGLMPTLAPSHKADSDGFLPLKIITVGRLSAEKGYFGLLEVLARMAESGHRFSITIVGDGPSADAIHDKAQATSLGQRVRFTGALSEAETLLEVRNSDIMVLPSLMEGLPVVLIEALAMRKAIVASRVAGIPELIDDGVTGLLFTPSDWADLETKLCRLLCDHELRGVLGENGYNCVDAEFTSDMAAAKLLHLFGDDQSLHRAGDNI